MIARWWQRVKAARQIAREQANAWPISLWELQEWKADKAPIGPPERPTGSARRRRVKRRGRGRR